MTRSQIVPIDSRSTFSRSGSLRAKLSNPFVSRKRHLAGFSVQTDDPYRTYSPREKVKGSVVLEIDRPVDVTHLVVCLHGCVKVLNTPLAPGKSISPDSAQLSPGKKQGPGYFGNGFASLLEHEEVLCGEGRLETRRYVFNFELSFPMTGLPSSIDFERGTITYRVTATLTRPSSIHPVTSCHYKIRYTDDIDISTIPPPKPKPATLVPSRRKSNKAATIRSLTLEAQDARTHNSQDEDPGTQVVAPSGGTLPPEQPGSPARSEVSTTSASSSSRSWHLATASATKLDQVDPEAMHVVFELSQGGCLPGDRVPIHVNVKHYKPIKNLHGVVVTLYRTGRVDNHPALPIGPVSEGSDRQHERYYPRSRTGLGGLSLSSPGSHKTFRQDLSQSFAPLITDPNALTAHVKTHVDIPEGIFPSITSVPGSMISFKYEVEIVVDLRGKLAGPDYVRSQLGLLNMARGYGLGDPKKHGVDGTTGLVFPLASGFGCLDTTQMRREKSVVSRSFELVVGTRDSERMRLRRLGKQAATSSAHSFVRTPSSERQPPSVASQAQTAQVLVATSPLSEHDSCFSQSGPSIMEVVDGHDPPPADTTDISYDDGLDEKTRVKNAEARLLPSAPPVDCYPSDPDGPTLEPSAPPEFVGPVYLQGLQYLQPSVTSDSEQSLATIVPTHSTRQENADFDTPPDDQLKETSFENGSQDVNQPQLQASSPIDDAHSNIFTHRLQPSAPSDIDVPHPALALESPRNEEPSAGLEGISDAGGKMQSPTVTTAIVNSQTPGSHHPPGSSTHRESSASTLPHHDDIYEAYPTPAPVEGERLPLYQR